MNRNYFWTAAFFATLVLTVVGMSVVLNASSVSADDPPGGELPAQCEAEPYMVGVLAGDNCVFASEDPEAACNPSGSNNCYDECAAKCAYYLYTCPGWSGHDAGDCLDGCVDGVDFACEYVPGM